MKLTRKNVHLWIANERKRLALFGEVGHEADMQIQKKLRQFNEFLDGPRTVQELNNELRDYDDFYNRINHLWIERAGMKKKITASSNAPAIPRLFPASHWREHGI